MYVVIGRGGRIPGEVVAGRVHGLETVSRTRVVRLTRGGAIRRLFATVTEAAE